MVAAKLATMQQGRPSGKDANLHVSRDDAARMLNVSPRTVATASSVRREATPELVAAVEAYEALHGSAKANGAKAANALMGRGDANAKLADAFTSDTAKKTGQSERAIST